MNPNCINLYKSTVQLMIEFTNEDFHLFEIYIYHHMTKTLFNYII